jgi:hypothetical protein
VHVPQVVLPLPRQTSQRLAPSKVFTKGRPLLVRMGVVGLLSCLLFAIDTPTHNPVHVASSAVAVSKAMHVRHGHATG